MELPSNINAFPTVKQWDTDNAQIRVFNRDTLINHLHQFWTALDESEKVAADKIRHQKRKQSYITAHGLLRFLLTEYCCDKVRPDEWEFEITNFGQPVLPPTYKKSIQFSISYTKNIIAIALASDIRIGMDIEYLTQYTNEQIPWHLLTETEKDYIHQVHEPRKSESFLKLWTLKEAFAKYTGQGISLGFTTINCQPDIPMITCETFDSGSIKCFCDCIYIKNDSYYLSLVYQTNEDRHQL